MPRKKQAAAKYMNKPVPNFIRKLINKKRMLWSKLQKNPNKSLKSKYNYAARAIKFTIKQYNDKKLLKLAQQKNLKLFYSYINNKLGRNINSKIKIINSDTNILEGNECNEKFTTFFHSTFTCDDGKIPSLDHIQLNSTFSDVTFSTSEIIAMIHGCSDSMSLGPDGFSAFFIKRISNTIALPLSILYQKSFNTGILSDT